MIRMHVQTQSGSLTQDGLEEVRIFGAQAKDLKLTYLGIVTSVSKSVDNGELGNNCP